MMDQISFLRRIVRQTVVLAGLVALMAAAGADWAHAATQVAPHAAKHVTVLSELHAIVLFAATIAFLIRTAITPARRPARAKARRRRQTRR